MTSLGLLAGAPAPADNDPAASPRAYRAPGVYVEFPRARRAISPRRTDITGFVGIARRGPLYTPIRVQSWGEFLAAFGGHVASGYLAYAVEAFFANGGRTAWVVRVAHPTSALSAQLSLADDAGNPAVLLTAAWAGAGARTALPSPGTWAHRMTAAVVRDGDRFDLTLRSPGGLTELWRALGASGPRQVPDVLGDIVTGSCLATASLPQGPGGAPPAPVGPVTFTGGADGLSDLVTVDVIRGIAALEPIDDIALLAVPDLQEIPTVPVISDPPAPRCDMLDATEPAPPFEPDPPEFPPPLDFMAGQAELIAQCERARDRFAILDPPRAAWDPAAAIGWRDALMPSSYAAAYFPWVLTPDPLRLSGRLVRLVPPSGHVAGVYARGDRAVGVHKPPANEALELAADVGFRADEVTHGGANDACMNIIRPYAGRGIRVAGARTLACRPPWRFVNVRRLVAMVEEAIGDDLAWTVFEPNNADLWAEVDRSVRGFLDGLWRAGMLDGATAAEAFDVRCDAETNPPDQRDLGRLSCLIALRPTSPAEFVVVRVSLNAEGADAAVQGVSHA